MPGIIYDKAALAAAARANDAITETFGINAWADGLDVDLNAVVYIADQRALRCAALLIDKASPELFKGAEFKQIDLSALASRLMPVITAAIIDGLAIGLQAAKDQAISIAVATLTSK